MRKITLGEMLKRFRIEKGLEASQVCRGLCSPAAMSYFESGERMPDTLMFGRKIRYKLVLLSRRTGYSRFKSV